MVTKMLKKQNSFIETIFPWIAITFGSLLTSFGYVLFIFPLDLFEGGVVGLGLMAKYLTGYQIVGTTSLAITTIVYIFAIKIIGKGFGARAIYTTIIANLSIDLFAILEIKKITDDILLASLYGGVVIGVGLGIVFFYGASTGGADAFAQIMKKLKGYSVGRTLISVDFFVLGIAAVFFVGIERIMYSFVFIFIQIKVIDLVLNGMRSSQRILIITTKPDDIKEAILSRLVRGVTIYKSEGAYTGKQGYTLTTVMYKKEIPELRRIISLADENAFVIIQDIHQVFGEGFEKLPNR